MPTPISRSWPSWRYFPQHNGPIVQLFRLGNACYSYQQQAEGEVTEDGFRNWLAGLPEKMRVVMARNGFEASKDSWPLRRHALERRDLG